MLTVLNAMGRSSQIRPENNWWDFEFTGRLSRGGVSREVERSLMPDLRSRYKML